MNVKVRLLRKPFTTALWLTLVTAMTVLLCVGGALWYSSESAAGIIDGLHVTSAYRTDLAYERTEKENGVSYHFENKSLSADSREYLESLPCVEAVYTNTLTGGYSPSFAPLCGNGAWHLVDESYDDVIVIATITDIEYPSPDTYQSETLDLTALGLGIGTSVYVDVQIHVEEYYCANESFIGIGKPWEKYDLSMPLDFLRREDASYLEVGQRYLVRGTMGVYGFNDDLILLPSNLHPDGNSLRGHDSLYFDTQPPSEDEPEYLVVSHVSEEDLCIARLDGTLEEFLADPANEEWVRIIEYADIAQHSVPVIGTESMESLYIFANNKAVMIEGRTFTPEEYASGERVCILSTTFAAQSGLKVGDSIPISQFWCVEEFVNGTDNYSTELHPTDGMLNNPTVGHVGTDTEFITNGEEFTVVGIYRPSNEWDRGSYSFTPNTVFIPKKAQIPGGFGGFNTIDDVTYTNRAGEEVTITRATQEATWGVYFSVKLKNGTAEEFREAIIGTDLENQFIITDQGYGEILESIRSISHSARGLLGVVFAGWALLLILYVLLYQGSQRKNAGIMRALGATQAQTGRYLWGSGMTLAVSGVTLGTILGMGIMDRVQQLLFDAATYTVTLSRYSASGPTEQSFRDLLSQSQLPVWMLLTMALVQVAVFAVFLAIHARSTVKQEPRDLMG